MPGRLVDVGWHTFILYTKEYAEFCDRIAGGFIHHVPDDAPGAPLGKGAAIEMRARTLEAIEQAGYLVDLDLWTLTSADCGDCHEEGNCSASGGSGNENTDTRNK